MSPPLFLAEANIMPHATARPSLAFLSMRRTLAGLLLLACLLVYANTLRNGFALDDDAVVTGNSLVTDGARSIPEIFRRPFLYGSMRDSNDLYRPMPLALFAAEHSAFGDAPAGFHAVNMLLFAGCTLLLFFFLDELLGRRRGLAFMASLLFALHPIHTEAVANIKSGDELLCFLFGFAALWAWLRFARLGEWWRLALAAILFLLSLLSKETSYSFVALVPLLFVYWERPPRQRLLAIILSVVFVAALAFALRYAVLTANHANHPFHIGFEENSLAAAKRWGTRVATAILTLGWYLKLLIAPWPLRADYSFNTVPLTDFGDGRVLLTMAAYLLLAAYFIRQLLTRRKSIFGLSILLFAVPLLLVSNLFFLVGATMAERFLFFPSAGFCLAAAQLLSMLAPRDAPLLTSKRVWWVLAPVCVIFAGLNIYRNSEWKDNYTLAKADMARTPQNFRIAYYLASATLNKANDAAGDTALQKALWQEATGYARHSIAIHPNYSLTQAQAGAAYLYLGRYDSSVIFSEQALALQPRDSFVRNNLAGAYFKLGRYRESAEQCRINVAQFPDYARAYLNLGACYLRLGLPDSAKAPLGKVLELEPANQQAAYFLSVANQMSQQMHPGK
jgi:tetratricopeptide (TPR) repeat protein